jgi:hypothetical protein
MSSPHRRSHSSVSAISTPNQATAALRPEVIDDSPRLDAEAKQLAHRKMAVERATHAKIDSFNRRIEDMIRLGHEALGSRIEVHMDDDEYGPGHAHPATRADQSIWEDL